MTLSIQVKDLLEPSNAQFISRLAIITDSKSPKYSLILAVLVYNTFKDNHRR